MDGLGTPRRLVVAIHTGDRGHDRLGRVTTAGIPDGAAERTTVAEAAAGAAVTVGENRAGVWLQAELDGCPWLWARREPDTARWQIVEKIREWGERITRHATGAAAARTLYAAGLARAFEAHERQWPHG